MRQKEVFRRYHIELFSGLALYMGLLFTAIKFAPGVSDATLRALLWVSPMLGFAVALAAIVKALRRMEEYSHMRSLEAIAISAAVTAGWTFTYGFLENAGFPRLSMFMVWPVMGAVWGGVVCIRRLLDR